MAAVFGGVGLITVISVAVVSVAMGSLGADPAKTTVVSKLQAIADVAAFASLDDAASLTAGDAVDGAYSRFYEVRGPTIWATVDAHDGHVVSLIFLGVRHPGQVSITQDDAVRRARAFLDSHTVPWKGLEEAVELRDHGEDSEFVVTWVSRQGNIVLPDSRLVGIDGSSGEVVRFNDTRHPYVEPGEPKVDEKTAIEAAVKEAGLDASAKTDSTELLVLFDAAGSQLLVWHVALSGPVPSAPSDLPIEQHVLVEVDAISGEAQVIGTG